jgi:pimeloyl-ACP methyl ester carboxylesterase
MSPSRGKLPPHASEDPPEAREVDIPPLRLAGSLQVPRDAYALVAFAHGSGSSRFSPRNRAVAGALNEQGIATLLFDLLLPAEEADRANVFNIALLADRLVDAVHWMEGQPKIAKLPVGLFGASTGAAAALVAAAELPHRIGAVVSRGGRPDLAGDALALVRAPSLLIVGSLDREVLGMNREAAARMSCEVEITIVPGATHLFEEPGTLDEVARLASDWFTRRLPA